jgi:hypothetical protein
VKEKKVRVKYGFTQKHHYWGELEMTEDVFNKFKDLPEEELINELLGNEVSLHPDEWGDEDLETFEII